MTAHTSDAATIRAFIAMNPGAGSAAIIAGTGLNRHIVWKITNNQARRGLLIAQGDKGARHYWLGRPPQHATVLTAEERRVRRAAAQKRSQAKRRDARRVREAPPAFVLPPVPEPPPARSCAVETVEEFRARCPSGYEVLPKKWPEILHYGRMADRLGAKG